MADAAQVAIVHCLGRWIQSQIPDIQVSDQWPEPDEELEGRRVSILAAGEPEMEKSEIRHVGMVPIDATTGLYEWKVAYCSQGLQLDLWAQSAAERSQMINELNDTLHKGELFTLGAGDPVRDGVLLQMCMQHDGFDGFVDYTFDGARLDDTPDRVRVSEYRATINGDASFVLTVKASSPRLLHAALALAVNGSTSETTEIF
jgi:hypothetical protein